MVPADPAPSAGARPGSERLRQHGRAGDDAEAAVAVTVDAVRARASPRVVSGNAEHGIRDTGEGPLRFVYAFATDSVDDVVYRFSDEG